MFTGRIVYWLATGALLGFGLLAILSIGFPFLLLGAILTAVGSSRLGAAGLWAAVVGFGAFPALILVWDVTSAPWACMASGGGSSLPGVNYYACVDTFAGPLTSYHVMAVGFSAIALCGLAWLPLHALWKRVRHVTGSSQQ